MGASYRLIRVGRAMSGMLGLDEAFEALHQQGRQPGDDLLPELVRLARQENYIPEGCEAEFGEALLREYRGYCRARGGQAGQPTTQKSRLWHGLPREQVAWYPTIREDLCNQCGKCVPFCSEKVFAWEQDKVIVATPFDCQVGCNSCERVCPGKAITLPPQAMLRGLLGSG